MILIQIEAPHFVAGLEATEEGKIVSAAPILRWAIGKNINSLAEYFGRKGWKCTVLDD